MLSSRHQEATRASRKTSRSDLHLLLATEVCHVTSVPEEDNLVVEEADLHQQRLESRISIVRQDTALVVHLAAA